MVRQPEREYRASKNGCRKSNKKPFNIQKGEKNYMGKEKYEKEFKFLEELRQSGATNMYEAGVYLREEFNISKAESYEILNQWMTRCDELSEMYGWEK